MLDDDDDEEEEANSDGPLVDFLAGLRSSMLDLLYQLGGNSLKGSSESLYFLVLHVILLQVLRISSDAFAVSQPTDNRSRPTKL